MSLAKIALHKATEDASLRIPPAIRHRPVDDRPWELATEKGLLRDFETHKEKNSWEHSNVIIGSPADKGAKKQKMCYTMPVSRHRKT